MLLGPGKKQTKKKIVPIHVVFIVCWENDLEAQERSLGSSKICPYLGSGIICPHLGAGKICSDLGVAF